MEHYGIKMAKFHILSKTKHFQNIFKSRFGEDSDSSDDFEELPQYPPSYRSLDDTSIHQHTNTPTVTTIKSPNIMSLPGAVPISASTPMSTSMSPRNSSLVPEKAVCVVFSNISIFF